MITSMTPFTSKFADNWRNCVKLPDQHTQHLLEMSEKVHDNTQSLDSVEAHFQAFLGKIQGEMQEAVTNMVNPEEDRMVKHEKRTHRLEEQMTQLIELLSGAANLE